MVGQERMANAGVSPHDVIQLALTLKAPQAKLPAPEITFRIGLSSRKKGYIPKGGLYTSPELKSLTPTT